MRAVAFALLVVASLAGCENGAQNMYDQAKYKPQAASDLWRDGRAARPLPPGTVAYSGGPFADTSSGRAATREADSEITTGPASGPEGAAARPISAPPLQIYSTASLVRGRERYDIFCSPCHGKAGDGDGYITRRGFPHPPSFHDDRLRGVADQYVFDVMTRGYGAMYPYADRITAEDRWAIVGYVRALQRSQHASIDDLPVNQRNPSAGAR